MISDINPDEFDKEFDVNWNIKYQPPELCLEDIDVIIEKDELPQETEITNEVDLRKMLNEIKQRSTSTSTSLITDQEITNKENKLRKKHIKSFKKNICRPIAQRYEESQKIPEPCTKESLKKRQTEELDKSIVGFTFGSLQKEISKLEDGQTLFINTEKPTSYEEPLEINRPIHLFGENDSIRFSGPKDCIKINSSNVTIEGLSFAYYGDNPYSAVLIENGSNVVFINCEFEGSKADTVAVKNCSKVLFFNCNFQKAEKNNLTVYDMATVCCIGCTITEAKKNGVELNGHSFSKFINTKILCNSVNGVHIDGASALFCECDIGPNEKNGIEMRDTKSVILRKNKIIKAQEYGIKVTESECTLTSNEFGSNARGALFSYKSKIISNQNSYSQSGDSESMLDIISEQDSDRKSKDNLISIFESNNDSFLNNTDFNVINCILLRRKGKLTATNSRFINNVGNGIQLLENTETEINECEFKNIGNVGIFSGRKQSQLNVNKCRFISEPSFASDKNIGIKIMEESKCEIRESIFSHMRKGIIFSVASGYAHVCDSVFENMISEGISIQDSQPLIEKTIFRNDISVDKQPADYNIVISSNTRECTPVIKNCSFTCAKRAHVSIKNKANPIFSSCKLEQSLNHGAYIDDAFGTFEKCVLLSNQGTAFSITKSAVMIDDCDIQSNVSTGLLIGMRDCNVTVKNSKIRFHTQSTGVTIQNDAKALFENCMFEGNKLPHVDIKTNSSVKMIQCDISKSGLGTGILIKKGFLEMENSKLHDESMSSLYLDQEGNTVLTNCEIYGSAPIYMKQESYLKLQNCDLHHNTPQSLTMTGGTLKAFGNKFHDQSAYAMQINKNGTNVEMKDNDFKGNRVGEINYYTPETKK